MLYHVVTQGPHHLLVESDHSRMTFQLFHVAVIEARRTTSIRHIILVLLLSCHVSW